MLRNEFEILNAHLLELTEHLLEIKEMLQLQNPDDGSKKRGWSNLS